MTVALVPTRDEAATIGDLVADLMTYVDRVIVVDGSANVDTRLAAGAAGAQVAHCTDEGLGPAYWAGWLRCDDDDWVLHVDAGGSHPRLSWMRVLANAGADITIGSRFCEGARYEGNPKRERMSRLAARMCNRTTDYDIADWTSGLRCYSPKAREILSAHTFATRGHAWQIEALKVALDAGLSIAEVPITYVAGESHLSRARVREAMRYWRSM